MAIVLGPKPEHIPRPSGTPLAERREPEVKGKTQTFTIGPEPPDQEEARRWLEAQITYPNLAGDATIAENAVTYVTQQRKWHAQRALKMRDKWRVLDWMLRGNSLSRLFPDSDVHVPELYKMVETIVPRIIEALWSYDPWFHVQGRDRMDRNRAKKIQAWLRYLLSQCDFEAKGEEIVRALIVYQFFAIKTWWDLTYRKQIVRDVERETSADGLPQYKISPREQEVLAYEGVKFRLVDPYSFVCDTRATSIADMLFVGDTCRMNETDIWRFKKLGLYENIDQLEEMGAPVGADLEAEYATTIRALDSSRGVVDNRRAEGQPREWAVTEIWCQWQPTEDHPIDEYVITVAEDAVALRVQKNFHDDKHRPYAVARAAKEPFDFWNVGILDHAVRLANEMDDHENLALKGQQNAICPITFVGHDFDGPNSIFDVEPGSIFRTNNPPTHVKAPSIINEHLANKESLRRDIEEVTGAPRIYEGTEGANTATEIERKIQEGNRRLRRLVMAASDGFTQFLEHTYSLSRQFVTSRKTFRVLGPDARSLGIMTEIGPEDLGDPVDFEISGVKGLQTYGLRATQMTSFLTQVGPLLPMLVQSGQLNVPGFFSELWEGIVGYRPGEDILAVPQPLSEMLPPDEENLLLGVGVDIRVHEQDPHPEHIQSHQKYADSIGPGEVMGRTMMHIAEHVAVQGRQRVQQGARGGRTPDFDQEGGVAEQSEGGNGRYNETPDLMGDVPQGTPPGETPGPPRQGAMGAPDRNQPVAQSVNRSQSR
jgi:hypothetical protein